MINDTQDFLDEHLPGIYGELPEIIREIWSRLPFGQEFTLSNGRRGRFKKFVEPRIHSETGRWECGFDVVFDEGSPDHLEFFIKHTGGGGLCGVPTRPISAQSNVTN